MWPAASDFGLTFRAEGVGFEPTMPCGIRAFQARALDQLCDPSGLMQKAKCKVQNNGAPPACLPEGVAGVKALFALCLLHSALGRGGGGGIRTHEALHLLVFETSSFNHSDTPPVAPARAAESAAPPIVYPESPPDRGPMYARLRFQPVVL